MDLRVPGIVFLRFIEYVHRYAPFLANIKRPWPLQTIRRPPGAKGTITLMARVGYFS